MVDKFVVFFIIDEISTIDTAIIGLADKHLQEVMGNNKDFGGVPISWLETLTNLGL